MGFETIRYETAENGVARIVLARIDARNAQNNQMTYELNEAFDMAALMMTSMLLFSLRMDRISLRVTICEIERRSQSLIRCRTGVDFRSLARKGKWPWNRKFTLVCAGAGETYRSLPSPRCRVR